jgi:magnesium-transporting ATPase (P-type)
LHPAVSQQLRCFKVFARMMPEEKEQIIASINKQGHHTLMMGDGSNDVGALKVSHVGCALLTGFGSMNVDKSAAQAPGAASATVTASKQDKLIRTKRRRELRTLPTVRRPLRPFWRPF